MNICFFSISFFLFSAQQEKDRAQAEREALKIVVQKASE